MLLGDHALEGWPWIGELGAQDGGRVHDGIGLALVDGERGDEPVDDLGVGGRRGADADHRPSNRGGRFSLKAATASAWSRLR